MSKRATTDLDKHIGRRLQDLRVIRGVSQAELGSVIGVTFQQVQKFEYGKNRIAAAQLFRFATHFGVSVDYFFQNVRPRSTSTPPALAEPEALAAIEFARTKKGFKLLRAIAALESEALRNCIVDFVEKLARKTPED